MAKWISNLISKIPWKILHKSTLALRDQELQREKEVNKGLLEDNKELRNDKKGWRDAYFQRNPRKT